MSLNTKSVDGREIAEVLHTFPVLFKGWECDGDAAIVRMKDDGSVRLLMTNHGRSYLASPTELMDKIKEYQMAIQDTNKALSLLTG